MLTSSSFKKNHDYIYQQALKWQANLLYFFFPGSTKESTQVGCCPMANSEQKINRKEIKKGGEREKKWKNDTIHVYIYIYIYIYRSLKLWIPYPEKREKIIGKSWNALSQQLGISINILKKQNHWVISHKKKIKENNWVIVWVGAGPMWGSINPVQLRICMMS